MTDVKQLVDQYADENRQLRGMVQTLQTALVLATSHAGKRDKQGNITLAIPAKVRTIARQMDNLQWKWSSPDKFLTHGSLRLKVTKRKETANDDGTE